MKEICLLIPEVNLKPVNLFGAIEIFERANDYFTGQGMPPYYDVKLVGYNASQSVLHAQINMQTVLPVESVSAPHLIIIPSMNIGSDLSGANNQLLLHWIVQQYHAGAEIASLCDGAFFLAATGLLDGKECAAHWKSESLFTRLYPRTKLHIGKIMTDANGIYTSGGGFTSLNLILYFIEKFNGREAAVYCSKLLELDINRHSQAPFVLFEAQKQHDDEDIKKVQMYIEQHVQEKFSIDELAVLFNISRRSFIRRFRQATNNSPFEYIQRIKIEAAKRQFEQARSSVNEVMYSVGYTDLKAFRTVFKKITGLSPIDYRNRYNKDFREV